MASVAERPDASAFDPGVCAAVISRALQLPGGADLVVGSLSQISFAVVTGGSRRPRSAPGRVLLAEWRYEAEPTGRLKEAHVVGGIVLAEETLTNAGAGWRVTRALRAHLLQYGDEVVSDIVAVVEGLAVACP